MSKAKATETVPILKVGSLIKLSDQQTIEEAMKAGNKNLDGTDYNVVSFKTYTAGNELLLKVAQLDVDNLYIIIKETSDGSWYAILAFVPDFFRIGPQEQLGGNRKDLVEGGHDWLFQPPDDVNKFSFKGLEFANSIFNQTPEGEELVYQPVHETLYGESSEDKMFAFKHYRADKECPNSELIVLEHGDLEDEFGGYITVFQGVILNDGELEVLK